MSNKLNYNKGLQHPTTILRKKELPEIIDWFKDRGYEATSYTDYSVIIWKDDQHLLSLKWIAQKGWVPELVGPTVHVIKDLNNVLGAIIANLDTLKAVQGFWELYQEEKTDESKMEYQGSQCPFYQKANSWGKILDEMEDLKALALEAANLLWDTQKNRMVDVGSEHRVYKAEDFKRVNRAIYNLLKGDRDVK